MSQDSPFTFHVVGRPDEPQHYELRDTSGRVVCKAMQSPSVTLVVAPVAGRSFTGRLVGKAELEAWMRRAVR